MTRETMTEEKTDIHARSRGSSTPRSDRAESEYSGFSIGSADSGPDSDLGDFDKNNNLSSQSLRAFSIHSSARTSREYGSGHESLRGIFSDMPTMNPNSNIEGARTAAVGEFAGEIEEYRTDDDVFTKPSEEENMLADGPELRCRHANAVGDNEIDLQRRLETESDFPPCDTMTKNSNQYFKPITHSVKLSSVRAERETYSMLEIQAYKGRMISKDGSSNVRMKKFGKWDQMSRYSKDIYTTLIDLSWTWVIFLTSAVYIGHWIIFGLIYWLFAIANDDYEKIFPPEKISVMNNINTTLAVTIDDFSRDPCVSGVYDFVTAFLFSMESETTIGYGYRTIGTKCKGAVACLVIQCVISAIFDTWVIGMCYSRIARPDARYNTIMFSKNGVICTRDGKKCLIVRVANLRKSLLLGVSCRARIITLRTPHRKETNEGHDFMLQQAELDFENANCAMLTAPVEYRHVIDKNSPLYSIPEECLASENKNWYEIVVILTGTVEPTGMTMHAQTSYLSTEVKYKHRFVPVVSLSTKKTRYIVNFVKFHDVVEEPPNVARVTATRRKLSRPMESCFEPLVEECEEVEETDV